MSPQDQMDSFDQLVPESFVNNMDWKYFITNSQEEAKTNTVHLIRMASVIIGTDTDL